MGDDDSQETHKQLRETLNAIRDHNAAQPDAGPLAKGLEPDDRLAIGSFFDPTDARLFQNALGKAGIGSSSKVRARRTVVSVEYEDREVAGTILAKHLQHHPNRRVRGLRRDFDGVIFGIGIGLTVGFIFGMESFPSVVSVTLVVPFVLLGVLLGHLYDRLNHHRRMSGRVRIGIWELLVVSTLPAALWFLWVLIDQMWTRG